MIRGHTKTKGFFTYIFCPKSDRAPIMVPMRFCIGDNSADVQHAYLEHHMTSCDLDLAPPYTHSYMKFMDSHAQSNNMNAKIRSIILQSRSPKKKHGTYTLGRRLWDPQLRRWRQGVPVPPEQMQLRCMKKMINTSLYSC